MKIFVFSHPIGQDGAVIFMVARPIGQDNAVIFMIPRTIGQNDALKQPFLEAQYGDNTRTRPLFSSL